MPCSTAERRPAQCSCRSPAHSSTVLLSALREKLTSRGGLEHRSLQLTEAESPDQIFIEIPRITTLARPAVLPQIDPAQAPKGIPKQERKRGLGSVANPSLGTRTGWALRRALCASRAVTCHGAGDQRWQGEKLPLLAAVPRSWVLVVARSYPAHTAHGCEPRPSHGPTLGWRHALHDLLPVHESPAACWTWLVLVFYVLPQIFYNFSSLAHISLPVPLVTHRSGCLSRYDTGALRAIVCAGNTGNFRRRRTFVSELSLFQRIVAGYKAPLRTE